MTDSSNNTSKASPPTGGESISKNIKNNQPNQVAHNTGSSNREFLAKEPIGKLLAKLALPTVAAQMIIFHKTVHWHLPVSVSVCPLS